MSNAENGFSVDGTDPFMGIVVGRLQRRFSETPEGFSGIYIAKLKVVPVSKAKVTGQNVGYRYRIVGDPEFIKPCQGFIKGDGLQCLRDIYGSVPDLSNLANPFEAAVLSSTEADPLELGKLSPEARDDFKHLIDLIDLEMPDFSGQSILHPAVSELGEMQPLVLTRRQ